MISHRSACLCLVSRNSVLHIRFIPSIDKHFAWGWSHSLAVSCSPTDQFHMHSHIIPSSPNRRMNWRWHLVCVDHRRWRNGYFAGFFQKWSALIGTVHQLWFYLIVQLIFPLCRSHTDKSVTWSSIEPWSKPVAKSSHLNRCTHGELGKMSSLGFGLNPAADDKISSPIPQNSGVESTWNVYTPQVSRQLHCVYAT